MFMDMEISPRRLFSISLFALVLSGLGMIALNSWTKSDPFVARTNLIKAVWKFNPPTAKLALHTHYRREWWKLLLAGMMISSLLVVMTCRIIRSLLSIGLGLVFLTAWYAFLLWYWYAKLMKRDEDDNDPAPAAAQSKEAVDKPEESKPEFSSWNARLKSSTLSSEKESRLPITIVTGFLGSGKTTLVKQILSNTVGLKILVIENEIGEEGIDHELLMQHTSKEDIILMNNGCVCCTVRNDLLTTFRRMFRNDAFAQLDWIVIETTGLADPAPLIQSFYMDSECQQRLRLDGVLTVVDAKHLPLHLTQHRSKGAHGGESEALKQIAFADRILLNKVDLVRSGEVESLKKSISEINNTASVMVSSYGNVDLRDLLNIQAFSPSKLSSLIYMCQDSLVPIRIRRDSSGKIQKKPKFELAAKLPESIPRGSGSSQISTISLVCDDPLDLEKFTVWISILLKEKGTNLYRVKGILQMQGYEERFVLQCIHMIFDGQKGEKWNDGETRRSRLVFIGIGLDKEELENDFSKTLS
eukprot:gene8044-8874_t